MTTALVQHEHDLEQPVQIARAGEDVVLTKDGQAIAKITALPPSIPAPITNLRIGEGLESGIPEKNIAAKNRKPPPEAFRNWVEKAAAAAMASATGKRGKTADEIVAELREERNAPTEAEMESRRKWLLHIERRAAEASTGKTGCSTTEEIIEDLRSERC